MINIIEYLDDKGIRYTTSGKNVSQGWIGLQCPYCFDRSNHLGINLSSNLFSCFVCGAKGGMERLVTAIEHVSYQKASEILQPYTTGILPRQQKITTADKLTLPKTVDKLLPSHKTYLESRNFDPSVYDKYQLKCFSYVGKYKFRLFIPYFYKRQMVTFTTRDITEKALIRYLACPVEKSMIPVKHMLYNIDNANDVVIVVEGVTDVWRIGDGAVALHGINYTSQQLRLLSQFRKVYILLDSTAMKQAEKLADDLATFTDVEILELDKGDPAELPESEVKKFRRKIFGK